MLTLYACSDDEGSNVHLDVFVLNIEKIRTCVNTHKNVLALTPFRDFEILLLSLTCVYNIDTTSAGSFELSLFGVSPTAQCYLRRELARETGTVGVIVAVIEVILMSAAVN